MTENLDKYELGIAAAKIYDFIWDVYCDWYIEITKPRLNSGEDTAENAQKILLYVLTEILTILHPFMPFITEEIYSSLPIEKGAPLMMSKYTQYKDELNFKYEEDDFESIVEAIRAVRSRRAEMNVPPSKKSSLAIVTEYPEVFKAGSVYIGRLAYASEVVIKNDAPSDLSGLVTVATNSARLYMPLADLVDFAKERERIEREIKKATADKEKVEQKLNNEKFTSKAPENIINAEREKLEKLNSLLSNLEESLSGMK